MNNLKISSFSIQDAILQQVEPFSISIPKGQVDIFTNTLKSKKYEFSFLNIESKRVLDWGSNFGIFAQWCFKQNAASVISIEPNSNIAKYLRRNTYFHQVNNKYLAIEGDLTDYKNPKLNSSNKKFQKRNNKIQSTNDFLNLLNVYKPEIIKIENLNNPLSKLRKIRDYILNNMPQISIKTKIKARLFKDVLPEGYICKEEIKVDNSTFIVNCIPPSFKEFGNKIYLENIHPKPSLLSNSVETSSPKSIDNIAFCILSGTILKTQSNASIAYLGL